MSLEIRFPPHHRHDGDADYDVVDEYEYDEGDDEDDDDSDENDECDDDRVLDDDEGGLRMLACISVVMTGTM